ncbi:hypothetical protein [Halobacterium bonnevillei]|uniref:Uncharacterized protein n=1 Tax=Halobacterium bonnevillei TaxID=2692200 RepID=A0A6B0SFC5_9EURY|nr:hypothetical protein [Halobacterium bonnevillei]MXR19326.1 hypothetical protein [Halobacterium bonnevillei]
MKDADEVTDPLHEITVRTQPTAERLSERRETDSRTTRESCFSWLNEFGRDPQEAEGDARSTRIDSASRRTFPNL